ncbi:MAG: Formamidopyrimidine-DNA glycolase [Chitinophagaceae bacterium]|nr:Formamidopyrimidine-DNA glycolase [Chitinophagaceae bacterium]
MPEGPSIVILKEELQSFKGKKVVEVSGNAKIDLQRMQNATILDFKSWGKHFLICFDGFFLRIHLLMFGTYHINETKDQAPRLHLRFEEGEFNFYTCSVKLMEGHVNDYYDWEADVMSDEWNPQKADRLLKLKSVEKVCDVLLDQQLFSGVGNIIKNEVLFRIKVHPESLVGELPAAKRKEMIKEARTYSFDFYYWKKAYELRQHWLIYKQKECPRCKIRTHHGYIGKTNRLTYFCSNCQIEYVAAVPTGKKKKISTS